MAVAELTEEEVALFDKQLKVESGVGVTDERHKGRLLAYLIENPAKARGVKKLTGATLVNTLNELVDSQAAQSAVAPGGATQHGDWVRDLLSPALIAGALCLFVPPAYSVRKVADQASEYLAVLGHLPHGAWTRVRGRSVSVTGGLAAAVGGLAAVVFRAHQHSRSGGTGGRASTKTAAQAQANKATKMCPRCSIKAGQQVTCQGKRHHDFEYDNSTKRDPRNQTDSNHAKKLTVSMELWEQWRGFGQVGLELMDKAMAAKLAPTGQ